MYRSASEISTSAVKLKEVTTNQEVMDVGDNISPPRGKKKKRKRKRRKFHDGMSRIIYFS